MAPAAVERRPGEAPGAVRDGADLASRERLATGSAPVASLIYEWIMRGWIVDTSEAAACSTTAS